MRFKDELRDIEPITATEMYRVEGPLPRYIHVEGAIAELAEAEAKANTGFLEKLGRGVGVIRSQPSWEGWKGWGAARQLKCAERGGPMRGVTSPVGKPLAHMRRYDRFCFRLSATLHRSCWSCSKAPSCSGSVELLALEIPCRRNGHVMHLGFGRYGGRDPRDTEPEQRSASGHAVA